MRWIFLSSRHFVQKIRTWVYDFKIFLEVQLIFDAKADAIPDILLFVS